MSNTDSINSSSYQNIILTSKRLKNDQAKEILEAHSGYIHKFKKDTGLPDTILRDIYTDTVLTVINKMDQGEFRGESKISTYFYKIFYFKAVDYMRKTARNKIDYLETLPEHSDETQDIEKSMLSLEVMSEISLVLDKMCPICRQIIMEWAYWGLSNEEIRVKIGVTNPAKFSKQKFNCLEKFKKLWNKEMRNLETI